MSKITGSKEQTLRDERNADVIRRMKGGDQLSSFNSYSSWFPPRPIIEKDKDAVKSLYGTEPKPFKNVVPTSSQAQKDESEVQSGARKLRLA